MSLTGAETLAYLANLRGGCDVAYRRTLIERFDFDPDKRIRALSKGNRQKVQIIAAFATRAEILILDEPTSGLDPLMEAAFRVTVAEARQRGQTIFLSSHILSEVEMLCERVGILSAGRLIDQGTLAQLRHLSGRKVVLTFSGGHLDTAALAAVPGVDVVARHDQNIELQVRGEMGPLLRALKDLPITTLDSREPSLEELFLMHYGDTAGRVAAEG
jgi:ABC-2 type transport system ATP-binding protein